jgi:hypothetical protein
MKKQNRKCKYCGKEYLGYGKLYCSRSCRAKDTGVGNGIKTGKFVKCEICGKKIWRKGYLIKKLVKFYCSEKCLGKANGERLKGLSRTNTWMIGIKNWAWKGGVTPENMRIRKSIDIREWRKSVFARDNWTCQECGQRGGELQADHIKPFSLFPEERFNLDNGRTLCKKCHQKTDTFAGRALKFKNL